MNPGISASFHLQLKPLAAIFFGLISCGGVQAETPNDDFDDRFVIIGFPTQAIGSNLFPPKIMAFALTSSSTAEIVWNSKLGDTYRIMASTDIITWSQRVEIVATDFVTTNTLNLSLFEHDAFRVEHVLEP